MGAGILPVTIRGGRVFFLFGKENAYADTPGWSDFGGGTESGESFVDTATREGGEELTGFLGSDADIKRMLARGGGYHIDFADYRMFLVPMPYDDALVRYYNANAAFLHRRLDPATVRKYRIFEKSEIRWVPLSQLKSMRRQFRSYFQKGGVDQLIAQGAAITAFVRRHFRRKRATTATRKTRGKSRGQTRVVRK